MFDVKASIRRQRPMHPSQFGLEQTLQQTLENVAGDYLLDDARKQAISDRLKSAVDPASEWAGIFRTEPTNAPSLAAADDAPDGLGHLSYEPAFLRYLARSAGASEDRLAELLIGLQGGSSLMTKPEAVVEWELLVDGLPIRDVSSVWLFALEGGDPFDLGNPGRIPCRLGLRENPGDPYVAFRFPAGAVGELKRPCIVDVPWDYQAYWRPVGRSEPSCVPSDPADRGLREFLTAPPYIPNGDAIMTLISTA